MVGLAALAGRGADQDDMSPRGTGLCTAGSCSAGLLTGCTGGIHAARCRLTRRTLPLELRHRRLHQSEHRIQIYRERPPPLRFIHTRNGHVFGLPHAMIGHQNIQPAHRGHGVLHQFPTITRRVQLLLDGDALRLACRVRPATLGRQRFGLCPRFPVAEGHPCSGRAQQAHSLRANAARSAGHQCNLSFKIGSERHRPTLKHCQRGCRGRACRINSPPARPGSRSIHCGGIAWPSCGRQSAA